MNGEEIFLDNEQLPIINPKATRRRKRPRSEWIIPVRQPSSFSTFKKMAHKNNDRKSILNTPTMRFLSVILALLVIHESSTAPLMAQADQTDDDHDNKYCCTWDGKNCYEEGDWCNEWSWNCEDECGGSWMDLTMNSASCQGAWQDCPEADRGLQGPCCDGMICEDMGVSSNISLEQMLSFSIDIFNISSSFMKRAGKLVKWHQLVVRGMAANSARTMTGASATSNIVNPTVMESGCTSTMSLTMTIRMLVRKESNSCACYSVRIVIQRKRAGC